MVNIFQKLIGRMLSSSRYPLDSKGQINLELMLLAYKSSEENTPKEKWPAYKIWNRVCKTVGYDNEALRRINEQTRYLLDGLFSAKTKGKILEKIGYGVI